MRAIVAFVFCTVTCVAASAAAQAPAPPASTGTLIVATDSEQVEVRVDGRVVGETPLAPLVLDPGPHALVFSAAGHDTVTRTASVTSGARTRIDVDLGWSTAPREEPTPVGTSGAAYLPAATRDSSEESPWYTRWYVIAGGAAVVAAAVVVIVVVASGGETSKPAVSVPPIE